MPADLRSLQVTLNRFSRPSSTGADPLFRPIPVDGEVSDEFRAALLMALHFTSVNKYGYADDEAQAEAVDDMIATGRLFDNIDSFNRNLAEAAKDAGYPATLSVPPSAAKKPGSFTWGYAAVGGVLLLAVLGGLGFARMRAEAAPPG